MCSTIVYTYYIFIYTWVTVKMVGDHFSIAGFLSEICTKHCKAIGPPKSDNRGPYTTVHSTWRKPSKYCYAHSQNGQNRWEKFNLWCTVSCSYHIIWHRTRSLAVFLSFFLSLFLIFLYLFPLSPSVSLSLSLTLLFLWPTSFEQCHMFEGLFSDTLSDNLAITICCTRSPGQAIEPFP